MICIGNGMTRQRKAARGRNFLRTRSLTICSQPATAAPMASGNTPIICETLVANLKIFYLDSKNGDGEWSVSSQARLPKTGRMRVQTLSFTTHSDTTRGETVDGIDPKEKTAGIDQTYPLSIGKDGLVTTRKRCLTSAPVIGCPAVTLWVSIDTPDVDLSAHLYEIQPDGTGIVALERYSPPALPRLAA